MRFGLQRRGRCAVGLLFDRCKRIGYSARRKAIRHSKPKCAHDGREADQWIRPPFRKGHGSLGNARRKNISNHSYPMRLPPSGVLPGMRLPHGRLDGGRNRHRTASLTFAIRSRWWAGLPSKWMPRRGPSSKCWSTKRISPAAPRCSILTSIPGRGSFAKKERIPSKPSISRATVGFNSSSGIIPGRSP